VKRGRRLLAVLAATAALAGCSTVRVAYDNADYFLRWRLGGYLDLRGDEQRELYRSIDAFLVWHRAQALPRYAALSEEAARRSPTSSAAATASACRPSWSAWCAGTR
jgi:hypothetical protein